MKRTYFIIAVNLVSCTLINAQKTNLAPSAPVTDEYFGTKIVDEYRNLEDLKDPATINWMKSQADYTDSVLGELPYKKYFVDERLKFDKRTGYSVSTLKITGDDLYFYLKKAADDKYQKLYYRKGFKGKEEFLYDPATFISTFDPGSTQKHNFTINFLSPSWDGSKIAISMSENGKEISEVIIMDVKTKQIYPEVITNLEPTTVGQVKWLEDNNSFFYTYFPVTDSNSPEYTKNTEVTFYRLGEDPKKRKNVFSRVNNPELNIDEGRFPGIVQFNQNDPYFIGNLGDVDDFTDTFIISRKDFEKGIKSWKPLYYKADKVYEKKPVGKEVYFMSGYNSPNFKLCKTDLEKPDFKNPEILVPEKKDETIKSFEITKDGMYYTTTKNGVDARFYLYRNGKDIPIKLPFVAGSVSIEIKGKEYSDVWIYCSGWANETRRLKYDLKTNQFEEENLAPLIAYPEFEGVIVEETSIKARDGVEVPLTLVYDKNIKKTGNIPVLIESYGSYGMSYSPFFARSFGMWAKKGGMVAIAHVRGGGEKGEIWHKAGYKQTKPNTWRDLIDCTEYLIKEGYTSKEKVAIWGGSAGGITVGRAVTERPDLFKAVIVDVGSTNTIRSEITPNGPGNIPEFGTVTKPDEFKALLEMDAFHHIKKGEKYPATLITTGINDSRVVSWMPAKFAAKLMANDASDNPILFKVDYEGGHMGGADLARAYANVGEVFAFVAWQLGLPGYQPKENKKK
ncbi:prolyl oligopeptidase family serine peptidase [Chryseobacterium sp. ISL-6]|uniref:prolyl oligopeptidase family serine peptidase n=1 Tax=Chryseobacterium sp. ISL-6 TaxID=2819143 RepID=UPI001BE7AE3C|nr:prolyl oligopeptidase family serine peptidase [Chryseobacterium sp. ISL-6]MBT2620978.1 prolyl oligopeptidase family serine peptidase [Chryseobacterium sp. ISL-6]